MRAREEEEELEGEADLRDEYDGFLGGKGGAARVFGGESRLMSGGGSLLTMESETCLGVGLTLCPSGGGLRATGGFCLGTYGSGPSSTTQSLRSMSDVLRPRLGGEGDGEGGMDLRGVEGEEGSMGEMLVAVGDIGVSRRSGGDLGTTVPFDACIVSKACMRALTADEAMAASRDGACSCLSGTSSRTSWAGKRAGSGLAEASSRLRRANSGSAAPGDAERGRRVRPQAAELDHVFVSLTPPRYQPLVSTHHVPQPERWTARRRTYKLSCAPPPQASTPCSPTTCTRRAIYSLQETRHSMLSATACVPSSKRHSVWRYARLLPPPLVAPTHNPRRRV